MKYLFVSLVALTGALAGCASAPEAPRSGTGALEGIVYDARGAPVREVEVAVAEAHPVRTDINGRFAIPGVGPGTHRVVARRDGFETFDAETIVGGPTDVLYLRLFSASDLAAGAQAALDRARTAEATELIERALNAAPHSASIRFLAAVIFAKAADYTRAMDLLDEFPPIEAPQAVIRLRSIIAKEGT